MSAKEEQLAFQMHAAGLPEPVRELVFAHPRRWRFDFAWPALSVAVEVEGGIWIAGGHSRGRGVTRDVEKGNEATLLGWLLVRVTGDMIDDGTALTVVERALREGDRRRRDGQSLG